MEKTLFDINPHKIYMIDEIADILRISRQTVTKDIRCGNLSAVQVGGHTYRVSGSHLLEYLNKRLKEAT